LHQTYTEFRSFQKTACGMLSSTSCSNWAAGESLPASPASRCYQKLRTERLAVDGSPTLEEAEIPCFFMGNQIVLDGLLSA